MVQRFDPGFNVSHGCLSYVSAERLLSAICNYNSYTTINSKMQTKGTLSQIQYPLCMSRHYVSSGTNAPTHRARVLKKAGFSYCKIWQKTNGPGSRQFRPMDDESSYSGCSDSAPRPSGLLFMLGTSIATGGVDTEEQVHAISRQH